MLRKCGRIIGRFFFLPIIIFILVSFYFEYEWEISLLISVIAFSLLNIILKAKIYDMVWSMVVSCLLLLGGIIGVIYYLYSNEIIYLSYIILFFIYMLFANLFQEKDLKEHLEYHIKKKLNSDYKEDRFENIEVFKKWYYSINLVVINYTIFFFGIIAAIFLVITMSKGMELLKVENEYGNGLGLLGVGLGILGFLGVLISMENSRYEMKQTIKNFYFITEDGKNSNYIDKLKSIDLQVIGARDIPYLFDLVVRENQKQAIITELQDIIKLSNSPSETKEEPKNESFLVKLFKLLNW